MDGREIGPEIFSCIFSARKKKQQQQINKLCFVKYSNSNIPAKSKLF